MLITKRLLAERRLLPGLLLVLVVALAATWLGHQVPIVGAPIMAIVTGIALRALIRLPRPARPGVTYAAKRVLQLAIILLGAGLSLKTVWTTGSQSFAVMIGTLLIALIGGHLIGRWLGLSKNITSLIAVGTSVCGASAISALSPVLEAQESEIAYSISTIFLFNVIAVFLFPAIGHLFHFSSTTFGMWAGTAINDTSSVVAAGYSFSFAAGQYATVVKLTRSLAIIPISLVFALKAGMRRGSWKNVRSIHFPLFILWFLLMSALDTFGAFGRTGGALISGVGQFLIVMALAAIGLNTNFRAIRATGYRPVLMGAITWALVAISSLILQHV